MLKDFARVEMHVVKFAKQCKFPHVKVFNNPKILLMLEDYPSQTTKWPLLMKL
jgi:hypothetical protein